MMSQFDICVCHSSQWLVDTNAFGSYAHVCGVVVALRAKKCCALGSDVIGSTYGPSSPAKREFTSTIDQLACLIPARPYRLHVTVTSH